MVRVFIIDEGSATLQNARRFDRDGIRRNFAACLSPPPGPCARVASRAEGCPPR